MNQGKICVSVCGETADEVHAQFLRAVEVADLVEIRFDCVEPSEIPRLTEKLAMAGSPLLLTFRPREQGGRRDISLAERLKFWEHALWKFNGTDCLIDYEFDLDLPLDLDADRTIISLHDFQGGTDVLTQFETLANLTGRTIKIAITANRITDTINIWKLLQLGRRTGKGVIPIAMGEAGKWTRILGLAHGAPLVYAALDAGRETAPGQISAADLRDVFRAKELNEATEIFGVVAADTSYSLSPFMHNAGFKRAGMNSVFVPLQVDDLNTFMRRMVRRPTREIDINFKGFSVTNPHKQAIMEHLDEIDETARAIGAVNTVRVDGDRLTGYNTDAPGFIEPLKREIGDLTGARVAVVGAGGAARAVVYALRQEGADVTVLARDTAKADSFADEFGVRIEPLTTDRRPLATDILVNATPLGTKGEKENESIATADELSGVKLVYDLVYNPSETQLLREAKSAGAKTLGGLDMLVAQGAKQFEIWTGHKAPVDEMKAAVEARLK